MNTQCYQTLPNRTNQRARNVYTYSYAPIYSEDDWSTERLMTAVSTNHQTAVLALRSQLDKQLMLQAE